MRPTGKVWGVGRTQKIVRRAVLSVTKPGGVPDNSPRDTGRTGDTAQSGVAILETRRGRITGPLAGQALEQRRSLGGRLGPGKFLGDMFEPEAGLLGVLGVKEFL